MTEPVLSSVADVEPLGRRAGLRDRLAHGRERPEVRDQRSDVLLVQVGQEVPCHPLPVERPPIARDPAPDGAGHLRVGPGANAGLPVRRDVPRPERAEASPADLEAARTIRAVAEEAGCDSEQVPAARGQRSTLGRGERGRIRARDLREERGFLVARYLITSAIR